MPEPWPSRRSLRPLALPLATFAVATRYVRSTSTPAVAGQRSTAGFSLQVGDYCSSRSVAPKAKTASECGEVPDVGTM